MSLSLTLSHDKYCKYDGKRYRVDYDALQEEKRLLILKAVEDLIDVETNLTLLEEIAAIEAIAGTKKSDLLYSDFLEVLRLKRIINRS